MSLEFLHSQDVICINCQMMNTHLGVERGCTLHQDQHHTFDIHFCDLVKWIKGLTRAARVTGKKFWAVKPKQ